MCPQVGGVSGKAELGGCAAYQWRLFDAAAAEEAARCESRGLLRAAEVKAQEARATAERHAAEQAACGSLRKVAAARWRRARAALGKAAERQVVLRRAVVAAAAVARVWGRRRARRERGGDAASHTCERGGAPRRLLSCTTLSPHAHTYYKLTGIFD